MSVDFFAENPPFLRKTHILWFLGYPAPTEAEKNGCPPGPPAAWAKFEKIEKWNYSTKMVSLDSPCDGEYLENKHGGQSSHTAQVMAELVNFWAKTYRNHETARNPDGRNLESDRVRA